jgi:hypothetical protein
MNHNNFDNPESFVRLMDNIDKLNQLRLAVMDIDQSNPDEMSDEWRKYMMMLMEIDYRMEHSDSDDSDIIFDMAFTEKQTEDLFRKAKIKVWIWIKR